MYLGMMAGGHHRGWGMIEDEAWRKGPWTAEEDGLLIEHVRLHGEGRWNSVARLAGLKRNGKSCRLRWVNYLRPELKRGHITAHEESIILDLHARWGNRWSTIARSLPGRTDNEIKNYWRTHFKKKAKAPSDASERAKTRLLRRQKSHNQQQQQQNLQVDQEVKRIMSLLGENETKMPLYWPHAADHHQEQDFFYSMLDGNIVNVSVPEAASSNEDNFLWDGFCNLNDVHANFINTTRQS